MRKGFTLIELLTVMAIIALLAAISLFSFQGARKQGRDAKRKADLETIRSALELYKADCNVYPNSIPTDGSSITNSLAPCSDVGNVYLKNTPQDPDGTAYGYQPNGTNTTYTLCATLEDDLSGSCSFGSYNYEVTSP